jgi:hypothetical protein
MHCILPTRKMKRISAMFSKTFNTILTNMLNKMAILLKNQCVTFAIISKPHELQGIQW